jgi:hypothetical protein
MRGKTAPYGTLPNRDIFLFTNRLEWVAAPRHEDILLDAYPPHLLEAMLARLALCSLVEPVSGQERHGQEGILIALLQAELPDGLKEWQPFDIANRAAHL